jgi:hypothetical protein
MGVDDAPPPFAYLFIHAVFWVLARGKERALV